MMYVITYPCWDASESMLVKGAAGGGQITICIDLCIDTLRLRQNRRHSADYNFKWNFFNGNCSILVPISLKLVHKRPVVKQWSLVREMAWCSQETVINHHNDVIMGSMASQITSLTIVYSTVYLGADQGKHRRSASLAFVRGIHRWPVNSPHKWPVTRKMFPLDDVIMTCFCHNTPQMVQVKYMITHLKQYNGNFSFTSSTGIHVY